MAKTKISVYLVKNGKEAPEDIFNDVGGMVCYPIRDIGVLYIKRSFKEAPPWVNNVFAGEVDIESLSVSSVGGVFVVPINVSDSEERSFAVSFGFGHSLIDKENMVERFGMRIALNLADEDSIRKLARTNIAGNALRVLEQLPKRSSIGDFSIDIEHDLLNGVTVHIEGDGILAGNVAGADSLGASMDLNLENVADVLKKLYELYAKETYKGSFEWVDRVAGVKSKELTNRLESRAIEMIREHSPDIWMAVPDVVNWEDIQGFRIVGGGKTIHDDIMINDVIESLNGDLVEFSQLKRRDIKVVGKNGEVVDTWHSSHCLYGEIVLDGGHYYINGGVWFKVDGGYADEINSAYERMALTQIDFPPWSGAEREAEYNKRFAESDRTSYALADARNISFGGSYSKVELCDILVRDGRFIHVKRYGGSSVLSHLFNQGLVSARLVKSSSEFREKAQKMLDDCCDGFDFRVDESCVSEVVYGISSKYDCDRPRIPFFSKVVLRYVASELDLMGVKVSVGAIKEID